MKDSLKTGFRIPLRTFLLILLSLCCAYYFYLHEDRSRKENAPVQASFVPIPQMAPAPKPLETPPIVKNVIIAKNQTFSELMEAQGFDGLTIQDVYNSAKDTYNLGQIRAGNSIAIAATPENAFVSLEYVIDPSKTLTVTKKDGVTGAEMVQHPTETRQQELGGLIEGSLYYTINRLGEEDQLVIDFASIFDWDIDFFKDLQEGDSFRIIYEKQYINGEAYGYGKIQAAELTNKGKTLTAIGYQRGKDWEFFSPDGKAMKKAFLASPRSICRAGTGKSA